MFGNYSYSFDFKTQFPVEFFEHVKNGVEFVALIHLNALLWLYRQHTNHKMGVRTSCLLLMHVYLFSALLSEKLIV